MTQKSILYIITKSVWGGAQKYVHDLAVTLPKDEFNVFVAAGGRSPLAEKIISSDIPYFEIKAFQRDVNILKDIWAFFEILFLLFKTRPDIVHVSSAKAGGVAGVSIFVYKLATLFWNHFPYVRDGKIRLRAIFTVHGWTFNEMRPKWQIALIKFFSKMTCLFYDKIICVSEYDHQAALKNKIAPEKKLITIHNGIKPEDYDFIPPLNPPLTKGGQGGVNIVIGTIGEATKNKGHEYLRKAVKNFPDIKLNIISNQPDAAKYLKNFDIFVLPSLKEGLPYVLLEAGLAELPVIATNVGGVPEIIENEKNGLLIPPANSEALTSAIRKLIQNSPLRQGYGGRLREKILKEFSFEKMLNATLATYED